MFQRPVIGFFAAAAAGGMLALPACAGSSDGVSSVSSLPGAGAGAGASGQAGMLAAAGGAIAPAGGASSGGASEVAGSSTGGSSALGGMGNVVAGSGGAAPLGRPSGPSAGCGKAFTDPFKTAVEHALMVNVAPQYAPAYVARKYYTQLPTLYDGKTAMPVVFYGQGCGQSGPEGNDFSSSALSSQFIMVQMIPAPVSSKTVVPSEAAPGCFEAGKSGLADSPDGPYFDQALAEVEAKYCIDQGKVYAAGWSSGAWLSAYLGCTRGNVLRGISTVAGGLQHDHGPCTGGAAALMIIGTGDNENGVVDMVNGQDVGTGQARDLFVKANGCSAISSAWDPMYKECQIYGSCDSPVVWCAVPGGHGAGKENQPAEVWKFWTSLK